VIVFLWKAGPAEGVTDDYELAQSRASDVMCKTGASGAVVEQARFIDGSRSLDSGYQLTPGRRWVGRLYPGGVGWDRQPLPVPELEAA
jgi:hypothetical protein